MQAVYALFVYECFSWLQNRNTNSIDRFAIVNDERSLPLSTFKHRPCILVRTKHQENDSRCHVIYNNQDCNSKILCILFPTGLVVRSARLRQIGRLEHVVESILDLFEKLGALPHDVLEPAYGLFVHVTLQHFLGFLTTTKHRIISAATDQLISSV